jgi:hypothetical protein
MGKLWFYLHWIRIASLANELGASVKQIDLEPYYPMGEGKSQELGRTDIFHSEFASVESKKRWQKVISAHTATPFVLIFAVFFYYMTNKYRCQCKMGACMLRVR